MLAEKQVRQRDCPEVRVSKPGMGTGITPVLSGPRFSKLQSDGGAQAALPAPVPRVLRKGAGEQHKESRPWSWLLVWVSLDPAVEGLWAATNDPTPAFPVCHAEPLSWWESGVSAGVLRAGPRAAGSVFS